MRWIDAPERPAMRTLTAWQLAQGPLAAAAALDALAARVRRAAPGSDPVVALATSARASAWRHVGDRAVERGGLLIGEPIAADDGDNRPVLVHVRAAVASLDDEGTAVSLRMPTAVWDRAREAMRPGEVVVGWFHSHPGIGAFFSATDRRTQAGFFHHPFSLGWVIDPQGREQAWFCGPGSNALAADALFLLQDDHHCEG